MLKSLHIEALGLIEQAKVDFNPGFTSITGETGSGKTSFIEALKLALGKKSDFELIKKGAQKASVTAVFELESSHPVYQLLEELELFIEKGEPLILTRILLCEGKSKAYLNQQLISLHLLQKIGPLLCSFIDQNDLLKLHDEYFYLQLLDKTGGLDPLSVCFKQALKEYKEKKTELALLQKKSENKDLRMQLLSSEIEELEKAAIKKGEEESLFEKYKALQSQQEQLIATQNHAHVLNLDILPKLKKMTKEKNFSANDQTLLTESYALLCELSQSLETTLASELINPQTLSAYEERLKTIHTLKRKYASDDFEALLQTKEQELDLLYSLEEALETEARLLQALEAELKTKAATLTAARQKEALKLEKLLVSLLRPLNMPYTELQFSFKETAIHEEGDAKVDLLIKTNSTSPKIPLLQGASGGELARVNFCFFLAASTHNPSSSYFFDEIDAHVGGLTSALMGDKLKELSQTRQVFCVTHFPQMALKASSHLAFSKTQDEASTHISFHYSSNGPLLFEIDRMVGVKE